MALIKCWLDAAKQEGLAARHAAYVRALERALVVMTKAHTMEDAILKLRV
ncbi:MAG: hypothetical protein ACXWIE_24235 [Burkholderiales bacterium]